MLNNRHIQHLAWLLASMMTLMLTACSTSDEDNVPESGVEQQKQPATLAVYVYAPEPAADAQKNAVRRRADVGNVDASPAAEGEIRSLQLWIFESVEPGKSTKPGEFVGYLETNEVATLNSSQGATYQIPVTDDFAARKPFVDVFVLANVKPGNCGVGTLDKETTRDSLLNGAKIVETKFGLSPLTTAVPAEGLPMAGHLTTQPVVGEAPALRVGSMDAVSTVQLTRAVSKLRFVFAKTTGEAKVSITSIKMNDYMIPEVEYFFKTPEPMTYNTEAKELLSTTISDIAQTADPTQFIYTNQTAQAYEDLINGAASKATPEVTVEGPIYLRESDKQLTGTITYTIGEGTPEPQTVPFAMQQAGDFLRNHTWIVYAYYAGSGNLQVQSLYVKDWSTKEFNHELYNW
jgi:hypothetical protein